MATYTKIIISAACAAGVYLLVSYPVFLYAAGRKKGPLALIFDRDMGRRTKSVYSDILRSNREYLLSLPREDVYMTSFDGTRLHGSLIRSPGSVRTVIFAHGLRSSGERDLSMAGRTLLENGCDLCIIDQRACGMSEGKYITYAVREGRDVALWARYVCGREDTVGPVCLYGVSLGASAVLSSFLYGLPDRVGAVVADCGFTGAYDVMKYVMASAVGRAVSELMMPGVALLYRILADTDIKGPGALEGIRLADRPVLIVHGRRDALVPFAMGESLCGASDSGLVSFLPCDEATHGMSYMTDSAAYDRQIKTIFEKMEETKWTK